MVHSNEIKIKYLSDDFQKYAFDISLIEGKKYVVFIIEKTTGIKVFSIEKADRVVNRVNHSSHKAEYDNHFLVNGHYYINIEVQYDRMSNEEFSDKCQFYLGMEVSANFPKGEKYGIMYEHIQIVIYNGSIGKGDNFIEYHQFKSESKGSKFVTKMHNYTLQLKKLKKIMKKKGMKKMSELEKLGFYIRYNEDEKYEEETKELRVMEEQVQYLDARFEEFYNNPIAYVNAVKAYKDREFLKATSKMKEKAETVKRMLRNKFTIEQISISTGLSIEEIIRIKNKAIIS